MIVFVEHLLMVGLDGEYTLTPHPGTGQALTISQKEIDYSYQRVGRE